MKYAKVLFFCCLLFCTNFLFAQNNTSQNSENPLIVTESSENGQTFSFDLGNLSTDSQTTRSSSSSVWMFVRMIIVLALVIAAIYAIMRFFRRDSGFAKPKTDDEFLRRVASLAIGPGKSVEVVTLIDHAYLLGVTDDNINLLGEIDDKELIDAMNLYSDKNQNVSKARTFSDVLEIFMPNNRNTQTSNARVNTRSSENIFETPSNNVSDAIKRQRERLNDMETE